MEFYKFLYLHYLRMAMLLMKRDECLEDNMEDLNTYIIKCCMYEMLLLKDNYVCIEENSNSIAVFNQV